MKAYKAFKLDKTCRGFKFEEGETYTLDGKPITCKHGFHFCKDLVLTLQYYPVNEDIHDNLYAEVEILGDIDWEIPNKHKGCTNSIKIIKFLSKEEVDSMLTGENNSGDCNSGDFNSGHGNSGDYNSGHGNSGDCNSGNYNSGNRNSGNRNSGNRNSGNHNSGHSNSGHSNSGNCNSGHGNSGNYNTGFFNTTTPDEIDIFNKKCSRLAWESAQKPDFLFFSLEDGKTYKECFIDSYNKASLEDKKLVLKLPNFDKYIFFEISGIDVSDIIDK